MSANDTHVFIDTSFSRENEIYLRIFLFVIIMCSSCLSVCLGSLTSLLIKVNRALPRLIDTNQPQANEDNDIEKATRTIAARACGEAIEMALSNAPPSERSGRGRGKRGGRARADPSLQ